jgi:3-hydroxyacyl-[acyl-carrier-protein] dehydratase
MLNRLDILERLPQGAPFVFVDTATVVDGEATGSYTFTGKECFAAGHFPDRPILPASIMVEALGQLGILYIMEHFAHSVINPESIFFIKSEDVACRRKCLPGDQLDMKIKVLQLREPLIRLSGSIKVDGVLSLKLSSMTLSFSTQP